MEQEKRAYYAIIPANVRYDNKITANAKLLYGEITALCNEKGYCWASNNYFAELYGVTPQAISKWINLLQKNEYIKIEMIYENGAIKQRCIYIISSCEKNEGVSTNVDRGINKCLIGYQQMFKDNNTYINNTDNNIYISKTKKETKHKYGEYQHVLLKDTEYKKLEEKYGLDDLKIIIDYFDKKLELKGYKYKSHYLAILDWGAKAALEENKKEQILNKEVKKQSKEEDYSDLEWNEKHPLYDFACEDGGYEKAIAENPNKKICKGDNRKW